MIHAFPLMRTRICHMHMTMDEAFRLVGIQYLDKCFKSLMWSVFTVIDMICRRVSQQNIDSFAFLQFPPQAADSASHLCLSILILTLLITDGTTQSENPDTPVIINRILNAYTSIRRMGLIYVIMISSDIKDRYFGKRCQKR